jgi:hypothetical protein
MTATLPPPLAHRTGGLDRRRAWLILVSILGVAVGGAICLGWLFVHWLAAPAPAPDQLRETLRTHKVDFQRLVAMMGEEDVIVGVHTNWVQVRDQPRELSDMGQDRHRLQEYRRLLKVLGLQSVERDHDGCSLMAWAGGALPDDGQYLGYKFFTDGKGPSPQEIVWIFTPKAREPKAPIEYMAMEPQWFLYSMR